MIYPGFCAFLPNKTLSINIQHRKEIPLISYPRRFVMAIKFKSMSQFLILALVTLLSDPSQAYLQNARLCNRMQLSGPIELEMNLANTHYTLSTKYNLMSLPLFDGEPRRIHIFKNMELKTNGTHVLISPDAIGPVMSLLGYSGNIKFQTHSLKTNARALILDGNFNIREALNSETYVHSVYLEELSYGNCF
jgi:hypothetical protein